MAEQPPHHEKLKSFDLMASVDMMRFDYLQEGSVRAETRQRVYDEELSSMAEGVDRASRTEFTLGRQGGELVYFDHGTWKPYTGLLLSGLEVSEAEQAADIRRSFLHEWTVRDLQKGYDMQRLQPGEKMSWHNAYPLEVEALYGASFMKECGLFPDRRMGFLYMAVCNEDGSVTLQSQTVDRSDEQAFEAAMLEPGFDDDYDMDTLMRTYDGTLAKQYGGKFYAGRRGSEIGENAWDEITRHQDLIEFFLTDLERLATSDMPRPELERATRQLIIGTWKAFKNRLGTVHADTPRPYGHDQAARRANLQIEINQAHRQARDEGDIKIGCGGSVNAGLDPINDIDGRGTFDAIFGTKDKKPTYRFDKRMYCVVCQAPPSETEQKVKAKKLCGPCGICRHCDTKLQTKSKGAFALAA